MTQSHCQYEVLQCKLSVSKGSLLEVRTSPEPHISKTSTVFTSGFQEVLVFLSAWVDTSWEAHLRYYSLSVAERCIWPCSPYRNWQLVASDPQDFCEGTALCSQATCFCRAQAALGDPLTPFGVSPVSLLKCLTIIVFSKWCTCDRTEVPFLFAWRTLCSICRSCKYIWVLELPNCINLLMDNDTKMEELPESAVLQEAIQTCVYFLPSFLFPPTPCITLKLWDLSDTKLKSMFSVYLCPVCSTGSVCVCVLWGEHKCAF